MMLSVEEVRSLSPRLSVEYLEEQGVIPLGIRDGVLYVGAWKGDVEPDVLFALESLLGAPAEVQSVSEDAGRAAIRRAYGESSAQALIDATGPEGANVVEDAHEQIIPWMREFFSKHPIA